MASPSDGEGLSATGSGARASSAIWCSALTLGLGPAGLGPAGLASDSFENGMGEPPTPKLSSEGILLITRVATANSARRYSHGAERSRYITVDNPKRSRKHAQDRMLHCCSGEREMKTMARHGGSEHKRVPSQRCSTRKTLKKMQL